MINAERDENSIVTLKQKRGIYRFSLRTLIFVTFLASTAMACINWLNPKLPFEKQNHVISSGGMDGLAVDFPVYCSDPDNNRFSISAFHYFKVSHEPVILLEHEVAVSDFSDPEFHFTPDRITVLFELRTRTGTVDFQTVFTPASTRLVVNGSEVDLSSGMEINLGALRRRIKGVK